MSWWKRLTARGSSPQDQTSIRVYLDRDVDAARVVVSDEPITRTVRAEGFGYVDLDADGNVVAIELFGVSKQIEQMQREGHAPPTRDLDEELRESATRLVDQAREHIKVG
jgi:uncharacterized protein YuzE